MKISDSMISLSADHAFVQADMTEKDTRLQEMSRISRSNRAVRTDPEEGPVFLVDRVSISSTASQQIQSEFKTQVESWSKVQSDDGSISEFADGELAATLVGGMIDREVTIRTIEAGNDIGPDSPMPSRGTALVRPVTVGKASLLTVNQVQAHYEEEQMGFSAQGMVVTGDGRQIDFSLDVSMDRAFLSRTQEQTLVHTWTEKVNLTDPLVISLDGGAPALSDTRFEFDLDSDGTLESVSFAGRGSGFLSFDRNGDGIINNGSELFGPGTGNGFGELGALDSDGNLWLDENDAAFSRLSVWTRNEQGDDVLVSLADAGIGAVYLGSAETQFSMTETETNALKGQVRRSGLFLFEDGRVGSMGQIDLAARAPGPAISGQVVPLAFDGEKLVPDGGMGTSGQPENTGNPTLVSSVSSRVTDVAPDNPLKALLDKIEELKEGLRQILGQEPERHGRRGRRKRSIRLSGMGIYPKDSPVATGFRSLGARFSV